MNFNIFNSIILAGIIQGFIFGIVVVTSPKYRNSGTWLLAGLIVCFSLNNLQYYLQDCGIITAAQLYDILFIPYQLVSGPLLLLYGLKVIYSDRPISLQAEFSFLPFVVMLLISTSYKILRAIGYENAQVYEVYSYAPALNEFFAIVYDQIIVLYLLYLINKNERREKVLNFRQAPSRLSWFRMILLVFLFLSFVWIYIAVQDFIFGNDSYYYIWIAMSIMIYWLGHIGIYKFGIQQERTQLRNYSIKNEVSQIREKPKNEHIAAMEGLLVGQRMFLDANLSLDKVAEELNISKSHLSRIINSELGSSFPDYINSLRVMEAKRYLTNPDFENYTLVAIGLEAGFNSKTTFNNAFKKLTGSTPSEFKNTVLKN